MQSALVPRSFFENPIDNTLKVQVSINFNIYDLLNTDKFPNEFIQKLFKDCDLTVIDADDRNECLEIFKKYIKPCVITESPYKTEDITVFYNIQHFIETMNVIPYFKKYYDIKSYRVHV